MYNEKCLKVYVWQDSAPPINNKAHQGEGGGKKKEWREKREEEEDIVDDDGAP